MPWPNWLPVKMKTEILLVNQGPNNAVTKVELMACVRTWVRRYFWQIRHLTREGRDEISMGFGANEAQVKEMEHDGCDQPFGNSVALKIKTYHHALMGTLRNNFDLLLKMFWNCQETQGFVNGQLMIAEAKRQAALLRESEGVRVRIKGAAPNTPIIDEDEVNEKFIKGDMKLVSDVWNCVLDVMDEGFLMHNEVWGQRFLKSTCIILSWYITFLFQLPDPKAMMEGKVTDTNTTLADIDVTEKTLAIYKGDLELIEWPDFPTPSKWGKRVPAIWYGVLVGSKGFEQVVREELEYELGMEYAKSVEGHEGSDEKKILQLLENGVDVEVANMEEMMLARAGFLEKLSKESMERAKALVEKGMRLGKWMKETKEISEHLVKGRMALTAIDQFMNLAIKAYQQAAEVERRKRFDGATSEDQVNPSLDVLGTFGIWFNQVINSGVLKELGVQYEAMFPPVQNNNWGWSSTSGHLGPGYGQNQQRFQGNQGGFQGFGGHGQMGAGFVMQQGWNNGAGMVSGSMGFVGSSGMGFQPGGDDGQQGMECLLGPTHGANSSDGSVITSGRAMPIGPQEPCLPTVAKTPVVNQTTPVIDLSGAQGTSQQGTSQ